MSLIDKEVAIKELRKYADIKCANGYIDTANGILKAVSWIEGNVPAADAEYVRYGHWEHDETGANYCSECNEYPYDDGEYHLVWHTDYCPRCGAKMEEVS